MLGAIESRFSDKIGMGDPDEQTRPLPPYLPSLAASGGQITEEFERHRASQFHRFMICCAAQP